MIVELEELEVRVVSESGEVHPGIARLSASREKKTVWVVFKQPILVPYPFSSTCKASYSEEFYLTDFEGAINVWGQGNDYPNHAWHLHPDDIATILAGGGG